MKSKILQYSIAVFLATILFLSGIIAQDREQSAMKQYLFPEFTAGTIKFTKSKPRSLMLNYNTVTSRMVFEQNGQFFDLTGQDVIDTIYLQGRKFIPGENCYLEVLYQGNISLAVQHFSNLQAPGKPVGYGGTSELASSSYITGIELSTGYFNLQLPEGYVVKYSPLFWVYDGTAWKKFLGARQFMKIFPEYEDILNQYIRKNKIKFDRNKDLVKLVEFCSTLIHPGKD